MQLTSQLTSTKSAVPWLMLISRPVLFFAFQALFSLVFILAGNPDGFGESARWWLFLIILSNFVSVYLLVRLYRAEGKRYLDILRFSRTTLKTDILWLLGTSVIGLPIAAAPVNFLATAIFGDSMAPIYMMFRPLPGWALALGILFPLTIAFAELTTYFGYAMPRLAAQLKNGWAAWLLASLFLGLQHCFLPFIPDARFILWRAGMYLPFALFAGLLLKLRPSLLPYFAIIHALVDVSALSIYWMV
ncbi:MAG: hypothetical protein EHM70_22965 [Chloroflexota bacterium]|nr:MAG: hypothetical protein EHM70_22965 [Chloroflexota bacterium]